METIGFTRRRGEEETFNFLASLINGNFLGLEWSEIVQTFNFLASLINGNSVVTAANGGPFCPDF